MPAAIRLKAASGDGRLLGWSAACSSGEEPYSIAMTLLDALDRVPAARQKIELRILATDISTKMVAKATAGQYDDSRIATIPAALRGKYITAAEGGGQVTPALRAAIRFRHLNLLGQWPFRGPFDFIFCRNVMIYFDRPTQQNLVDRIWHCLRPGGLLFTGHSESLTRIEHRFANRLPSIYEKV